MSEDGNREARHIAQSVLRTEERLLWSGRPDPRRVALQTLPVFILGLPWIAIALYWTAASFGFQMPDFNAQNLIGFWPVFGFLFILMGLVLTALPGIPKGKSNGLCHYGPALPDHHRGRQNIHRSLWRRGYRIGQADRTPQRDGRPCFHGLGVRRGEGCEPRPEGRFLRHPGDSPGRRDGSSRIRKVNHEPGMAARPDGLTSSVMPMIFFLRSAEAAS